MENEYSKREIDNFMKEINDTLKRIETQTLKTNGSVISLKGWRTGLAMCISVVAFVVIPLVVYSFNLSQENLKQSILLEIKNYGK